MLKSAILLKQRSQINKDVIDNIQINLFVLKYVIHWLALQFCNCYINDYKLKSSEKYKWLTLKVNTQI